MTKMKSTVGDIKTQYLNSRITVAETEIKELKIEEKNH